jgi:hypothetical protein
MPLKDHNKMNHTTVIKERIILRVIALSLSGLIVLAAGGGFAPNNSTASAQSIPVVNTLPSNASATELPSAASVYQTETMKVPDNVKPAVIYAANELHEDIEKTGKYKLISDRNPYFVPKKTIVSNGTTVVVHNADAPWDIPHPHTFVVGSYNSTKLDYATNTQEFHLAPGIHKISVDDSPWAIGSVKVVSSDAGAAMPTTSLIVGTFYTPTTQVSNPKDNDMGTHPGNLAYYMQEFPRNALTIESTYNFTYTSCSVCPGKFWTDNKTANHTLIVWSSTQPLPNVLAALTKLTKANVYI